MTVLYLIQMYQADSDTAGITIYTYTGAKEDFVYSDFKDSETIAQYKKLLQMEIDYFEIGSFENLIIHTK